MRRFRCHQHQPARIPETRQSLPGQIKSLIFGLSVQGKIDCLLVGIGTRVHEGGFGCGRQFEQTAECPAAHLFEHDRTRRYLPVGYPLVVLQGDLSPQIRPCFQEKIVKGVKSRMAVIDKMGDQAFIDQFRQILDCNATGLKIQQRF